jgi:hypothetical protein
VSLFGRSEAGARTEVVPSAPLDVYLTSEDAALQERIERLLVETLSAPSISEALAKFAGEKTRSNYVRRIRDQLEIIVLNVVQTYPLGQTIGMPRGKTSYVAAELLGPSGVTREIIDVADALNEIGLLGIHTDREQEFVSRVIPSEDLVRLIFDLDGESKEIEEHRLISSLKSSESGIVLKVNRQVLYDDKNGQKRSKWKYMRVPYKALAEFDHFEERTDEISRWQEFLWSFEVTYAGPDYERKGLVLKTGMLISRKIERHFRDTLELPLRFYGAWQHLPAHDDEKKKTQDLRRYIQINGQRTVELDFGCFFPVLILTQAGINWTDRFRSKDAYQLERLHYAAADQQERRALRRFLKSVFVTFCFDTIHTPENVMRRLELDFCDFEECEMYGAPEKANEPAFGIIAGLKKLPVREAVDQVVREYCSMFDGVDESLMDWKLLQQQESRITELVLNSCLEKKIPCLPIHDGYRVVNGDHFQVMDFMNAACLEVTGSRNFFIKLEDPEGPVSNT